MSKGRRYDKEPKLNIKKVIGVIIALIVIILIIFSLSKIVNNKDKTEIKASNYFSAYTNNKYGVIDNNGNIVIEPIYDEIVVVPNKTRPIFICTYDINDQDGTYKTKVLNEKNEEIITEYEKVEAIDNFDSKQNVWYEDNVLRVYKEGKYGLIDFEKNVLLPCEYEEIMSLKSITNNILIKKDGKYGLVNEKGQIIIKPEYREILTMKEEYKSEYIIANMEGKYGIISTSGTVIIEPKYEQVKYISNTNLYAVKEAGVWKLLDNNNKILLESGYDDIVEAKGENVVILKAGKYGIIDTNGTEKIPAVYEDLKYVFSIYYIAKKDGKYGVINLDNENIINFEYTNMFYVEKGNFIQADKTETETVIFDSNLTQKISGIISTVNIDKGFIKVYTNNEYKYYNFKMEEKNNYDILTANTLFLSKKEGKYGYIDKTGKIIIDYIYEDGTEQNSEGYAAVKKDGVWGVIDKAGKLVLEPSITLDNNIYIDFIDKWHLSDSGLYYTK